ncbi:MAG: osmosensitive channel signal transduction histidine kinase, sensor subunit KdpD [Bacteriovoracaceae bacterium]|nr:osmosensitive channel signal transduction histidine kinase, sensor subunit KdpD [Bacteriovoracaceae bacterium]
MPQFDEILERRKKGSLKIYLGYAAGVGKTYAMLQEALRLKARGFDVVIGYLEPHDRSDTAGLVGDLESISRRAYEINQTTFYEMDVNAILDRKPQIVLIDELAHTNAPHSKHEKRYEDVLEILDHRINVISTLNVQHLESIADKISAITGVEIRERLPDSILQRADQIVNVDLTIEDLRERLRMGKIYSKEQAERAMTNFFSPSNLSVLRETALKEAAGDQIRRIDEQLILSERNALLTHETVMVCLSSDPTSAEVLIRKGCRMAMQLSSQCYVVYVQSSEENPTNIDAGLQRKLQNNLTLAKRLDAEVITLHGDDIASLLCNFALEHNVRHAVFGKSRLSPLRERFRGSVLLSFIHDSVGVDVHILSSLEGEER